MKLTKLQKQTTPGVGIDSKTLTTRPSYLLCMMRSDMLVQYGARKAMCSVLGPLGTNRVILRHKFGVPREKGVFSCQYMVCEEDRHRANLIGELVQVRDTDGHLQLHLSQ